MLAWLRARRWRPAHRHKGLDGRRIPRDDRHHQHDRADVEHQHPGDDRRGGPRDRRRGFGRFRGGDRDDFRPEVEAGGGHGAGEDGQQAVRREPAVGGEIGEVGALAEPQADDVEGPQHQEDHDRPHLDRGEPEFELAVHPDRSQVRAGCDQQQGEREQPLRELRKPEPDQIGAGDRFECDHAHPEIPVHPHPVTNPARSPSASRAYFVDPARRRSAVATFQHADHQHDQEAGQQEGDARRWPGGLDHHHKPTNSSAPITPWSAIMVMCRRFRVWRSRGSPRASSITAKLHGPRRASLTTVWPGCRGRSRGG